MMIERPAAILLALAALGGAASAAPPQRIVVTYRNSATSLIPRGPMLAIEVSPYALDKRFNGTGRVSSFHKVIMVAATGGHGCTSFITADGGVSFTDRACASINAHGRSWRIRIEHVFSYPKDQESDAGDATKSSEIDMTVNLLDHGCRAIVTRGTELTIAGRRTAITGGGAACRAS